MELFKNNKGLICKILFNEKNMEGMKKVWNTFLLSSVSSELLDMIERTFL